MDLVTSIELKRTLDGLLERESVPSEIHADLRHVQFMDTSGVAVLVGTRVKAIAVGSRLVVMSASAALQRLFDVTGLAQILMP